MFEGEANRKKPHSFQQKKKKKGHNPNENGDSKSSKNFSVSATTSKSKTPIPPNQAKKVNNKKAAKKKKQQQEKLLELKSKDDIENIRKNNIETPLSSTSESSTTRVLLNEMNLIEGEGEEGTSSTDNSSEYDENYEELPCDALILNTETVEKIIEQIETDIESETGIEDEGDSFDSSDEFGEEEALNTGVQRYFLENSGPKCFNCGESGHVLRDCPATSTVPCNLCGQLGHSRSNCPQEVCYNCSRPGHQSKACPAKRKRRVYDDDLCNRCGQPGHLARECSMAWRGYVFARDLPRSHSTFLDELRGLRKRCYNCASISHFGDDCPNRRRPNFSVFHIPDYDYLDRTILRIKAPKNTGKNSNNNINHNQATTIPVAKKEPNAKQKQADNFKKIVQNNNNPRSVARNVKKSVDNFSKSHKSKSYDDDVEMYDSINVPTVSYVYDDDYDNRNVKYQQHQSNNHNNSNRKVFLQSRGVDSDDFEGHKEKAVSFVSYEGNQVKVKDYDGNEDDFKKGSSKKKFNNGPRYRGGYK